MDRETVISDIEQQIRWIEEIECHKFPGWLNVTNTMRDALELLKEQEAVKPKVEKAILDYQSWHYICGDCGGQIDINDNYCRHCGRVVAHLSNKI